MTAASLMISTPEGSGPGCLPNLLTSVSRTPTPTKSLRDRRDRKVPACSNIMLPEEIERRNSENFCVRNTFINSSAQLRSPSLEAFYRERNVRTCPSDRIGILEGLFKDGAAVAQDMHGVPEYPMCPDTPCQIKTPSCVHEIRTPCGADMPLEQDWVAQMNSGMAPEVLSWSMPAQAYQPQYQPGVVAAGPYAPCDDAQQYYAEMAPQVHVESVAVSAVGPLAAEAAATAPAPAAQAPAAAKTVVSLADSLDMSQSPHALLSQKEAAKHDPSSSSSVLSELFGAQAFSAAPPAHDAMQGMSGGLLDGLGIVYGHGCSASTQPAEGFVSEMSWATPSQPSSWGEMAAGVPHGQAYGGAADGGVPLYSAPSQPPTLPGGAVQESWGAAAADYAAPAMPAPVLSAAAPSMPSPPSRPALGSDELPSIGSQAHAMGQCKPCAFLHTKGCENGLSCQFCHLCENGEKKRRRKAKLESQRAMRKAKQGLAGTSAGRSA